MEDAATAEISRAQVWQWVHHHVALAGPQNQHVTAELVRSLLDATVAEIEAEGTYSTTLVAQARQVFDEVSLSSDFPAFLTIPAYQLLP